MTQRDGWSKAEIIFGAMAGFGGIAVPMVLAYFGMQISARQDEQAEIHRQAERLANLIEPLASENARKRAMASQIAQYLAENGQLPDELIFVLVGIVDDPDADVSKAVSAALTAATEGNAQLRSQVTRDLDALPARVYFHISEERQRGAARKLANDLTQAMGADYRVPGVERKPGPAVSELRFFKSSEQAEANQVAVALTALGVNVQVKDLSARFGNATNIRPRHFELWLGDDFT